MQNIQCLFLVYPFSFKGKLIQYIGRVQRGELSPTIYDYRDYKIDYLNKLFLKRNSFYRNLNKTGNLFDDQNSIDADTSNAKTFKEIHYCPIKIFSSKLTMLIN